MNVIIRTLGIQRNTFVDQFYELLSFFSGDFADLRHGFSIGRKKWLKMAQEVMKIRGMTIC